MYHLCLHGWDEHPCIGRRVCHTGPAASSCPAARRSPLPVFRSRQWSGPLVTAGTRGAAVQCVSRPCGSPRQPCGLRSCMGADGSPEIPRSPIERAMSPRRSMTRDAQPTPARKAAARPPRYTRTSTEWPCIFKDPIATERLDPSIKKLWESRRGDRPKWGDLRTTFRRDHCRTVNPWGSETCPFKVEECALAFYRSIEQSLNARNPYGYFTRVCRSSGAARADLGVELRARMRTDVTHEGAMGRAETDRLRAGPPDGLRAGEGPGPDEHVVRGVDLPDPARGLRGLAARPAPLGDVLRSLDLGSRPRPGPDGAPDEGGGR